jgi:hypothetical protein
MGTTVIVQKDALAQDKSTSITCNDSLPCERTLCIDGDCETAPSNSSQISPIQESNDDEGDDESDDKMNSIRDTIAERTSLRVMNHLRKVDLTMDDVYPFEA